MRIILEVDDKDEISAAVRALLYALERPTSMNIFDWRKKVGAFIGIRVDGLYWTVKTTKKGWSVRKAH